MSSLLGHQTPPTVPQNEKHVTLNAPLPYVTDQRTLESLCHTLRQSPRLALDTEFVGEDTFIPRLELIQVATATTAAVIDFPAVQASGSLDVFWNSSVMPRLKKSSTPGGKISIFLPSMRGRSRNRFSIPKSPPPWSAMAPKSRMRTWSSDSTAGSWRKLIPLPTGVRDRSRMTKSRTPWKMSNFSCQSIRIYRIA